MIDLQPVASTSEAPVLILAPLGQDAKLAAQVLNRVGIASTVVKSIPDLCEKLKQPTSLILITEEALTQGQPELLKNTLSKQAAWSDLPIVLLTSQKEKVLNTRQLLDFFSIGGNIALLERPFRTVTLIAAVQVGLRARRRQYQVRDLLDNQTLALRQRDEFLSIASHELKTPLTSLKLQTQIRKRFIKRGDRTVYTPDKVDELIASTEKQVDRLTHLVDDMLDISRIENGKLSLNPEQVDLNELVKEVLEAFSGQFQNAKVVTEVSYCDHCVGNWDRYRIEQVIANLFTNAIKYGGGKPVKIAVSNDADHAKLSVTDRGIGISTVDQDKIFQRFERASSAKNISGLGLGLYITGQILELHGGAIYVQSKLGEGSTFTIELPLVAERGTIHDEQ